MPKGKGKKYKTTQKIAQDCSVEGKRKIEIERSTPQCQMQRGRKLYSVVGVPIRQGRIMADGKLVSSMNLDEMLEASNAIEIGFRGEKIPTFTSSKARKYAIKALQLNKNGLSKKAAKKMQQDLVVQIVERNKSTTDKARAEKLYRVIMNEK